MVLSESCPALSLAELCYLYVVRMGVRLLLVRTSVLGEWHFFLVLVYAIYGYGVNLLAFSLCAIVLFDFCCCIDQLVVVHQISSTYIGFSCANFVWIFISILH